VSGSCCWKVSIGLEPWEVDDDDMDIGKVLGEKMAWVLKKINT